MKVNVRCIPEHSPALVGTTTRRLHQQLSRFGHRLSSVDVRLSDVNGPRGGLDKRCLVIARGPGLGSLRVEELHQDFYVAVDLALERLSQTVARSIARIRRRRFVAAERRAS